MSDSDSMTLRTTIINLCDRSFPQKWTNENRELCRIYVGQLMRPMLDVKIIRTEQSASIMYRVGWFLREDGKLSDSERLSLRASEISADLRMLSRCRPWSTSRRRTGRRAGRRRRPRFRSRRWRRAGGSWGTSTRPR